MPFLKQVVILAGGKGTRMREMTTDLPKPMVSIGDKPVIDHLIEIFEYFGNFEFVIPTGYLGNIIEEHFKNKKNVRVVETGLDTNTGGRIKKLEDILEERFLVTYGDGLANVNINKLIDFHKKNNSIGTMTVTNPVSRFGLVNFNKESRVESFIEKTSRLKFIRAVKNNSKPSYFFNPARRRGAAGTATPRGRVGREVRPGKCFGRVPPQEARTRCHAR